MRKYSFHVVAAKKKRKYSFHVVAAMCTPSDAAEPDQTR